MRWYLLFPFLMQLYVRSRLWFGAVGIVCYVVYFLTPFSVADAGTLPCFMLGMIAADLIILRHPAIRYALPLAIGTLALAAWQQAHDDSTDLSNPLWHAVAFFCVSTAGDERVARVLRFAPLAFVGVASYSIYLIHEPVLESLGRAGLPAPLAAVAGDRRRHRVLRSRGAAVPAAGVSRAFRERALAVRSRDAAVRRVGSA